jgi:hypothetical protein
MSTTHHCDRCKRPEDGAIFPGDLRSVTAAATPIGSQGKTEPLVRMDLCSTCRRVLKDIIEAFTANDDFLVEPTTPYVEPPQEATP